jgi:hypothetical protein
MSGKVPKSKTNRIAEQSKGNSPEMSHSEEEIISNQADETQDKKEVNTTDMEIHHPHKIHHDKHIKDYLFEFLMLFLAITGGFLTENIRENKVERHREKEYVMSLIRDVKEDTASIKYTIRRNQNQIKGLDSLLTILEKPLTKDNVEEFYLLTFKYLNNYTGFTTNDITMTQLKNSGGLRLIENNAVSDSIVSYYSLIDHFHELNVKLNYRFIDDAIRKEFTILDFSPVRNKDRKYTLPEQSRLKELYNLGVTFQSSINWDNQWLKAVSDKGVRLLGFLEKEYNVKE